MREHGDGQGAGPSLEPGLEQVRERLRRLLVEKGFLVASKTNRLVSRSGRSMSWMLYTPAVTLTSEGSLLAGHCLLQGLSAFKASQLATYGYTGLPLMMASLLWCGGRLRGLVIEDRPNSTGEGIVNGDGERPGPVVVVDDSLVSGTSFFRAARILEQEGFQVEGLLCLVEFPGRGGRAAAEAAGYRVQAVFELERDLEIHRLAEQDPRLALTRFKAQATGERMDPVSDPVSVVRRTMEAWPGEDQGAGEADCPHEAQAHVGLVVELRDRASGRLMAREGLMAPTGPSLSCTVEAYRMTKSILRRSSQPGTNLSRDRAYILVRLLSQAEEIAPAQIGADEDALVLQSRMNPSRTGYVLRDGRDRPEITLYLAAQQMAGLGPAEPHAIYRCRQQELIEAGAPERNSRETSPAELPEAALNALAEIARDAICISPLGTATVLEGLCFPGAGVAWYENGRLLGCWLSWNSELAVAVRRAATQAWKLTGRQQPTREDAHSLAVLLTVLDQPRHLGEATAAVAAELFDLGKEALVAANGKHSAAVFPHFVCHHGWSGRQTAEMALRKAGIPSTGVATWSAYRSTSWLIGERLEPLTSERTTPEGERFPEDGHPVLLEYGFPRRPTPVPVCRDSIRRTASAIADYLVAQINDDGVPAYLYDPVSDTSVQSGPVGRILFAMDALCEAGTVFEVERWLEIGRKGLQHFAGQLKVAGSQVCLEIEGDAASGAAHCELLAALAWWLPESLASPAADLLVLEIRRLFKPDGMISEVAEGFRMGTDPDILPGVALVALGRYAQQAQSLPEMATLDAQLAWYRRRFRLCRPWAMIGWQMQGWSVVNESRLVPRAIDFVFEMADWAIASQLKKNGAFLTELAVTGPGFHTAYIAEGIADAWRLAIGTGDLERAGRYSESWKHSMQFMEGLILQKAASALLPNPAKALGGVRASEIDARLRVDYAAHHLRALAKGMLVMERRSLLAN